MEKSAIIDEKFRYHLGRTWIADPFCLRLSVMMLNPSTADAFKDDPTIRRVIGFAKREGYGGIDVVNLFAIRSTKPSKPNEWTSLDVGHSNDDMIQKFCFNKTILAAWGVNAAQWRIAAVTNMSLDAEWKCLGVTASGHPRHPLYVKADAPFVRFKV